MLRSPIDSTTRRAYRHAVWSGALLAVAFTWRASVPGDSQGGQRGVGGVGNPDAGRAGLVEGREAVTGDLFARREHGDARWVRRDELGDDPTDGLVDGHGV
jgi:hypothetical protein